MRLLLGIALTSICCLAAAADTPQVAAARRLVDLMQIDQMYQEVDTACRQGVSKMSDAKAMYAADSNAFGGISPNSAYWGEVERVVQAYWREACGVSDTEAIKNIYVQVYANRLSLAELDAVIASALTPEGRKSQLVIVEASRYVVAYQFARQQENLARATERFQQGVRDIAATYKAAPR